jgi:pimeloyl-ACP methyl ester carboxylesterase
VPFERFTVEDNLNRKITAYLSTRPTENKEKKLPLILFIGGSGCQSVWMNYQGKINGGLQELIYHLVKGRARVLVVEKPGVKFLDAPEHPGSAEEGSKEFLEEHTLSRWTEANMAALKAVMSKPEIDLTRIMVVGHSEGGDVAALIAAMIPAITNVAPLGCGGVTQLFDLAELARSNAAEGQKEAAAHEIFDNWAKILKKPNSIDDFWMGHPYRRWSTFIPHSIVDDLKRTKAKIYLAQGTEDQSSSVVGFDVMFAELLAQGRDVTAERIEGGGHSFNVNGDSRGIETVFRNVVEWFLR